MTIPIRIVSPNYFVGRRTKEEGGGRRIGIGGAYEIRDTNYKLFSIRDTNIYLTTMKSEVLVMFPTACLVVVRDPIGSIFPSIKEIHVIPKTFI